MKKLFTLVASFLTFAIYSMFLTSAVSAKVITVDKGTVTIAKDEVVNDDLFVGAENVEIDGTINGNVYAGAQTIRVNGTVNGSLHTGASAVYLGGIVSGNVYIGAGNVSLSGAKIGDSLHVGAGNINIDRTSTVDGSLIAGAGSMAIYGPVTRNVMIGGGSVDLDAEIGGEVRIGAGDITIGPNTKIGKDLYYMIDQSQSEIKISDSASVSGMVTKVENKIANKDIESARENFSKGMKNLELFGKIISLLGALLIGYLWYRLYPKSLTKSSDLLNEMFLKSLGKGFLITVFAIPGLLLISFTMIGLPLAGLLLLILLLGVYLSKLVVGMSLGTWIANKIGWKKISSFQMMAIGLALIYILKMVHGLGFITSVIVLWSGIGALFSFYKSQTSSK